MIKKKRKLKKWVKIFIIIFITLIIIILLGVGIMINKKNNTKIKDESSTINTLKENNTPEDDTNNNTNEDVSTKELELAPSNNEEYKNLPDGEYRTNNGYTLTVENGVSYIDGLLIVNKTYSLPSTYQPINPYTEINSDKCNNCLENEVMNAFKLMQSDAYSIGLNLYISSGYRSYNYQNTLYNNYSAVSTQEEADTYSARAGYSEHQTGLCFDLNSVDDSFAYTEEGIWVNNNAYLYGFIIRYPSDKEDITGYIYESWHLRYVGVELASILYNNGDWITLEEYYGLSSSY